MCKLKYLFKVKARRLPTILHLNRTGVFSVRLNWFPQKNINDDCGRSAGIKSEKNELCLQWSWETVGYTSPDNVSVFKKKQFSRKMFGISHEILRSFFNISGHYFILSFFPLSTQCKRDGVFGVHGFCSSRDSSKTRHSEGICTGQTILLSKRGTVNRVHL